MDPYVCWQTELKGVNITQPIKVIDLNGKKRSLNFRDLFSFYTDQVSIKMEKILILPTNVQELVVEYCHRKELNLMSVLRYIAYEDDVEVPVESVIGDNLSVKSTSGIRKYAVLYVPALLKFLSNPDKWIWCYISENYREAVDKVLRGRHINPTLFMKHVEWSNEGVEEFEIQAASRKVMLYDGTCQYLNLEKFKAECLEVYDDYKESVN